MCSVNAAVVCGDVVVLLMCLACIRVCFRVNVRVVRVLSRRLVRPGWLVRLVCDLDVLMCLSSGVVCSCVWIECQFVWLDWPTLSFVVCVIVLAG